MIREKEQALLLAILILGLGVRLVHLWAILGTAFPRILVFFPESDMYTYWQWAQTIVAGDWLGRDTYHPSFEWMQAIAPQEIWYRWWGGKAIFQQAPLYPYLLAGLLTVSGGSLALVSALQLLVGAFHPLVMFWLGRRLFDSRVGLAAAGLTAVYGPFVFHEGTLLRDWLPPILEPLALLALLKARESGRSRDWALAGVALGVTLLTREAMLIFMPVALLWLVCAHRGAAKEAAASMAALLFGFALIVSPLIVRNVLVGAPAVALSNRAGEAFIVGNAADGFPIGLTHPPSMKGILERSGGRLPAVIRETLETYQGDWRRLGHLQLLRLRALADPLEVPNNVSFYYALEISPILRLTLPYGVIFPLGLAGFGLALVLWRRHLLLALYGLSIGVGLAATTIVARYRIVLVPVLIIYAAVGLVRCFEAARARRVVGVISYVALLAGAATLQHLLLPIPVLRDMPAIAIHPPEYFIAADIYATEGRFDRAVAEIARLLTKAKERPSFGELAGDALVYEGNYRVMWASRLLQQGLRQEARQQAERAQAAYSAKPELSYPFFNLGFLYLKLGETARARAFFERFLALEPDGATAERVHRILRDL